MSTYSAIHRNASGVRLGLPAATVVNGARGGVADGGRGGGPTLDAEEAPLQSRARLLAGPRSPISRRDAPIVSSPPLESVSTLLPTSPLSFSGDRGNASAFLSKYVSDRAATAAYMDTRGAPPTEASPVGRWDDLLPRSNSGVVMRTVASANVGMPLRGLSDGSIDRRATVSYLSGGGDASGVNLARTGSGTNLLPPSSRVGASSATAMSRLSIGGGGRKQRPCAPLLHLLFLCSFGVAASPLTRHDPRERRCCLPTLLSCWWCSRSHEQCP